MWADGAGAGSAPPAREPALAEEEVLDEEEEQHRRQRQHHRAGHQQGPVGRIELLQLAQPQRQRVEALVAQVQQRADEVRFYLVSQGLPETAVTSRGLGMKNPIASNDTAQGRQKNRRVELIVGGEVIGTSLSKLSE